MAKSKIKCSVIAGENKGSEIIATDFFVNCLTIMVKGGIFRNYAVDIKHTNTEKYEIIDQEIIESNSSEILYQNEDLKQEVGKYITDAKQEGSVIAAVKFKDGKISVLEIDEKKLVFLINALRPHPLTQFI